MKKNSLQAITVMAFASLLLMGCGQKGENGATQGPTLVKELTIGDATSFSSDFNY